MQQDHRCRDLERLKRVGASAEGNIETNDSRRLTGREVERERQRERQRGKERHERERKR